MVKPILTTVNSVLNNMKSVLTSVKSVLTTVKYVLMSMKYVLSLIETCFDFGKNVRIFQEKRFSSISMLISLRSYHFSIQK